MKRFSQIVLYLLSLLLVSCKQPVYYSVSTSVQPAAGGKVTMAPSSDAVMEGTSVSFKATPNDEYVFSGWSGDLSGTENPLSVTVSSDLVVIGNFTLRDYPLTLSVEGNGSITEKVIPTKTEYVSGTVVELTAVPSSGWSFDHWEGDLNSSDNPAQITVSSAKSVKAVFTKNHYAYNLKIVGPGAVDEYLVEDTKATLEHGTQVLLKALPLDGAFFKGWSGDLTGAETEVIVSVDKPMEIVAEFGMKAPAQYPLLDLTLPSCLLDQQYVDVDVSPFTSSIVGYLLLDYNRDGYLDLVTTSVDYDGMTPIRYPIRFYLGVSSGGFSADPENDMKFESIDCRKIIQGDFNNDGFPDIFFLGHGYDADPYPGEYPMVVLSNNGPHYTEHRFTDIISFFHGGASGDIDADGDLDVFLTGSRPGDGYFFINDGNGNFEVRRDMIDQELILHAYTCEMFDIDHDGFLDLVLGGHDHEGPFFYSEDSPEYKNMPAVFWGNGKTYDTDDYIRLPNQHVPFNVALDYCFIDLDSDGNEEIIVVRSNSYAGWMFQVLKRSGRTFTDVTDEYFSESGDPEAGFWVDRICVKEINGQKYLLAMTTSSVNPIRMYTFSEGHFNKIPVEKFKRVTNSFPISYRVSTMKEGWGLWAGIWFPFSNGADLSYLVDNQYCLEFFLSNTDPELGFDIHFETRDTNSAGETLMYGMGVNLSSLKHDGTWERIVIPLNDFQLWGDSPNNHWNHIDSFLIITTSSGGVEFSVKDIRIRKVLPEE